jgi:ABC-type lipoprotein export system ATPase subunit
MLLELQNVSKTYHTANSDVCALDDVTLSIDAGQFQAVQGPSGCGKTTLLLIAGGLLAPDSGTILVDGKNPYSLPPNDRAQFRAANIGFVFQQFHLIPYLGVLDNVLAPAIASGRPDALERAQELIAHFGMQDRLHHVPAQLSTGERQRTALARALLNEPKILLADEPTGNLDHENAAAVLGYLKEFTAGGGAVLLVTHDDRAVEYAESVTNIDGGKIITPQPA